MIRSLETALPSSGAVWSAPSPQTGFLVNVATILRLAFLALLRTTPGHTAIAVHLWGTPGQGHGLCVLPAAPLSPHPGWGRGAAERHLPAASTGAQPHPRPRIQPVMLTRSASASPSVKWAPHSTLGREPHRGPGRVDASPTVPSRFSSSIVADGPALCGRPLSTTLGIHPGSEQEIHQRGQDAWVAQLVRRQLPLRSGSHCSSAVPDPRGAPR